MKIDKYKIDLSKAVKKAIVSHIVYTPEKETLVLDHNPISGELTMWIDGRYKVTIKDLLEEIKHE